MKAFIGTTVVIIILVTLLAFAVVYMIRQKKKGHCATCPYYESCEKRKQEGG
ncbi:MAG: FeoB-associated Cys-rich membrane protein [Ruminococcus sp.]|nr:FeoB-associated Cys-rich membrane protein [Ruminococcus sp.]